MAPCGDNMKYYVTGDPTALRGKCLVMLRLWVGGGLRNAELSDKHKWTNWFNKKYLRNTNLYHKCCTVASPVVFPLGWRLRMRTS